ncbi:MAG: phosphoribosyltransferase [Verrucomicrobia bacterium]|nr:phosphoribosyltransferase [Verrucomicrobiota bacterium]MBU6446989.1 phosphoribosyltransferase [Verrucomicrobiota bacterium]MDE3047431.1 phosphoribosyltransferase [Verrucomicrobiota bacterium]
MMFKDRSDAGRQLAQKLLSYQGQANTIVFGLARGGVVVAYEVARILSLPLNVLVPRKIGAPGNPELALGAVAEDGELMLNEEIVSDLGVSPALIQEAARQAKALSDQRLLKYRQCAPLGNLQGKTAIVIDDGIATGATMLIEIQSLRKRGLRKIIAAAPVAALDAWSAIQKVCDEAVCLHVATDFGGISEFYLDFAQVEDEQVQSLLQRGKR